MLYLLQRQLRRKVQYEKERKTEQFAKFYSVSYKMKIQNASKYAKSDNSIKMLH